MSKEFEIREKFLKLCEKEKRNIIVSVSMIDKLNCDWEISYDIKYMYQGDNSVFILDDDLFGYIVVINRIIKNNFKKSQMDLTTIHMGAKIIIEAIEKRKKTAVSNFLEMQQAKLNKVAQHTNCPIPF